jgi:hypothetical protein
MKNWKFYNRIRFYFKRLYRISVPAKKQEELVWKDLKKTHTDSDWRFGIYEREKYVETVFSITDDYHEKYYYMLYDNHYHCRVRFMHQFPCDLTTDMFVLATHFNNVLKNGVVVVNPTDQYVEYRHRINILVPLLYSGEIHAALIEHFNTSRDIYAAFQRLVLEGEAPAIIIADLLNSLKNEGQNDKDDNQ